MKRIYALILAGVICALSFCSCGKYDKITSSADDLREVGTVNSYTIYYDELRCSVMNAKTLMAQSYNIDWNDPTDAEQYREELERRVFSGLKYNYAVQILFAETGYTIENEYIQRAVDQRMVEVIDECGGRWGYIQYLKENFLTDRVLRFNVAIAYAVNELIYSLCDSGAFDGYGIDFDIESLTSSNPALYYPEDYQKAIAFLLAEKVVLTTEHIYVPEDLSNSELKANDLFEKAQAGEKLSDLAKGLDVDGIIHEKLTTVEGELTADYYNAVLALDHGSLTLLHLESGYYILRRLELDLEHVMNCYFDLIYTYLSIKTNENLTAYEAGMKIELTEFGKGLDLTKIQ